tara:strand:+ start:977 stop:1831 length:855 start_codon:yes stop_codon:yes gene_type:complete
MNNYSSRVNEIIDNLDLPEDMAESNKGLLKARFLDEVTFYEKKRDKTKKFYNVFRFIVTTGSILLPAILSLGQMDPTKLPKNFDQITYWSSWSISLSVTISNGFLQLFSLDKNFYSYSLVVEQLKTEGWQYFGLSGKYEEYDIHSKEAYKEFCKAVENIKRKQVEQEFQGKGNGTKKKKETEFDFDGKMKEFMNNSKNNDMFEPLIKAANTASNISSVVSTIDNIGDTLKQNVNSVVSSTASDIKNDLEQNLTATFSDIENNLKLDSQNKPVLPLDDSDRDSTQ